MLELADGELARDVAETLGGVSVKQTSTVLTQVAARFDDLALVAARESDRRSELAALAPVMLSVPWMSGDIHDVAGLALMAGHLRGTD